MSQEEQQQQEEMLHLCLTGFYLRKPVIKASQEFVLQCSPQNNAAGRVVHSDFDGVYNNPLLLLMIYLLINEAGVMWWRGVINGRAMAETVSTQLSLITGGTRTK